MPSFRRCKKCNQHEVRAEQRLVAAAAEDIFKVGVDHVRCPQITRPPRRATSCHQQLGNGDHARLRCQSWTSWRQAAGLCSIEPAPCSELALVSSLPDSNFRSVVSEGHRNTLCHQGYAIYAFECNPGATFSDQINEDDEVHQQLHTP